MIAFLVHLKYSIEKLGAFKHSGMLCLKAPNLNRSRWYHTAYVQSGLSELDQLGKIFFIFLHISWLKIVTLL